MNYDISSIRENFPILSRKTQRDLLVLADNASTTQKPLCVLECMDDMYRNWNSNVDRGSSYLGNEVTRRFEAARETLRRFINAKYPEEIIFTNGASWSLNIVALGIAEELTPSDNLVVGSLEHNSGFVPFVRACKKTGAELRIIPLDENNEIDYAIAEELIDENTKLVSISSASNTTGAITDVKRVVDIAHKAGAMVMADLSQCCLHRKTDVQDLDVDFACFSGHKLLSPQSTGILYGKRDSLLSLPPVITGSNMAETGQAIDLVYRDIPKRFEIGSPNAIGIIAMAKAVEYLESIGMDNIMEHEQSLLDYTIELLSKIDGLKIIGQAKHQCPLLSFTVEGLDPLDINDLINEMGVSVRTGSHCSEALHTNFGIDRTCRISWALYNTKEDVARAASAIKKAIAMLKRTS